MTPYRPRLRRALALFAAPAMLCLAAPVACTADDGPAAPSGDSGGTGSPSPNPSPGPSPGPTSGRIPGELVGTWYSGDVSPTQFYNPNTGQWGGSGYSKGLSYTFTADGSYQFALQLSSQLYGCGTQTLFYATGTITVSASGPSYTLRPKTTKRVERNSCAGTETTASYADDGESNYYQVRTGTDGGQELWTRNTDGSDPNWYRMRRLTR